MTHRTAIALGVALGLLIACGDTTDDAVLGDSGTTAMADVSGVDVPGDAGNSDARSDGGTDAGFADTNDQLTDTGTALDSDGGLPMDTDDTSDPPPDTSDSPPDAAPDTAENLPVRYLAGSVHSPITPFVAANLQTIAQNDPDKRADVFMKVGASSTVSRNTMHCFAGDDVELDGRNTLQETIDHFLAQDLDGSTSFDRDTLAAESGRGAAWSLSGDPSPLDQEIRAIAPRYSMIHYGTNDMQLGSTYASASYGFAESFLDLIDAHTDAGIVPLLFTIFPRGDREEADHWVDTYNAIIRGAGEGRQIPVVDVHLAVTAIPERGLSSDGIHPNVYRDGGRAKPCVFTPDGLDYGFNVRNLVSIEALHRARRAMDAVPMDVGGVSHVGDGSPEAPLIIDQLPFTHMGDTAQSPHRNLDRYTGCDADQNESGPEQLYRLVLDRPTRLRAMVFDRDGVDIDVHLLGETPNEEGCLVRAHRLLQGILQPGTYHLSLDSFVSANNTVNAGEYLLIVLECHPDDANCDAPFE